MHKVDRNKVDDHGYLTVVGPNFETPSNIVKKIIENFDTVVSQVTGVICRRADNTLTQNTRFS